MVNLSIVVPAYNEEKRIEPFLTSLTEFCSKNLSDYEIILVNDGSTDKTLELIKKLLGNNPNHRVVSYDKNKGKGGAIREGVLSARGDNTLFIDADGSISPEEIPAMVEKLKTYKFVTGSRIQETSVITVKQPKVRVFVGRIFNKYVNLLFGLKIYDLLCGFKGFRTDLGKEIFKDLKNTKWIFDVEIMYKAKKNKAEIYQLPIKWKHTKGTKLKFTDPLKMGYQILKLRMLLK